MRRYPDCIRTGGLCGACSAPNRGLDYHNSKTNKLLYQRSLAEMTQQQIADATKMNIRQTQKFESGEGDLGNMTPRNALALTKALDCGADDSLQQMPTQGIWRVALWEDMILLNQRAAIEYVRQYMEMTLPLTNAHDAKSRLAQELLLEMLSLTMRQDSMGYPMVRAGRQASRLTITKQIIIILAREMKR